jgi:hypothetical protein
MSQNPSHESGSAESQRARFGRGKIAAIAIGALLLGSFAFGPVRAIASQVLGIFRVQRIQTISISQADLEKVGTVLAEGNGSVSLESLGDVSVDGASAEPSETTLAAAQAAVDFPVKTPAGLEGTPTVVVQSPMTMKFKLHIDKVNQLLESYGATKLFSPSLDGKEFSIEMPATVVMAYPDPNVARDVASDAKDPDADPDADPVADAARFSDPTSAIIVAQTRGPQLHVPAGVNPLEIRDVLLGLPFLPDNVRKQLAGVQDWQSTLLIPNIEGTSRDISVGGMPGVVISPKDEAGVGGEGALASAEIPVVVMWNDNGVMRAVGGTGGEQRVLSVAESVAR